MELGRKRERRRCDRETLWRRCPFCQVSYMLPLSLGGKKKWSYCPPASRVFASSLSSEKHFFSEGWRMWAPLVGEPHPTNCSTCHRPSLSQSAKLRLLPPGSTGAVKLPNNCNSSPALCTWVRTVLQVYWIGCDILVLDKAALSLWPFAVFFFVVVDSVIQPGTTFLPLNGCVYDHSTCKKDWWRLQWHKASGCPGTGPNYFGCLPSSLKVRMYPTLQTHIKTKKEEAEEHFQKCFQPLVLYLFSDFPVVPGFDASVAFPDFDAGGKKQKGFVSLLWE